MKNATRQQPRPITKTVVVRADSLAIHPTAQRELSPSRLAQIRKVFDLDAIGTLHAVEYEIGGVTRMWIIDGQHRLRVLLDEGFGEWIVKVEVHVDCHDDARASELFLWLNFRLAVNTWSTFRNSLQARHPDAVGIERIARENTFKIGKATTNNQISCVASLGRVYAIDRGVVLDKTLSTILAAWGHNAAAIEGKIIEGLGLVYKTYNGQIETDALVKKLAKYPGGASALIGDAKGLRQLKHNASMARCVAERVIDTYNANRRHGTKLDPL